MEKQRILTGLQWAFATLAVFTMLYQYGANRSLWLDEASLALNIQERSFVGLLQPLDYDQAAPIGFLLMTKIVTTLLGINEFTLRLFPLLLGMVTLILFYWVAKQISPCALLFGFALFATSAMHIRYATEFKQYITDGAVTLLLIGLAFQISKQPTRKSITTLTLVGATAVWFSHPTIFVLAGIGLVLLLDALRRRDRQTALYLVLMGGVQVVSFFCVYFFFYQKLTHSTEISQVMSEFWAGDFMRPDLETFTRLVIDIFVWVGGLSNLPMLILSMTGFVIGVRLLKPLPLALLLSPLIFMVLASLFHLYPARDRFLLFVLPLIMLIVAIGWWDFIQKLICANRFVGWATLAILLTLILVRLDIPQYRMEARDAFQWIQASAGSNDEVFATSRIGRIADFYHFDYQLLPDSQSDSLPNTGRFWLVIADGEEVEIRSTFDAEKSYSFPGVTVVCVSDASAECPA